LNSPESTENTEELVKRISDLRDSGNECLDAAWSMFIMANGPYTASCILLLGIPTEFTLFTRLTNNTFDYIATLTGETVPPLTEALRLIYPKCEIHPRLEGTFQRAILAFRA
jgi:hypothetical protein